MATALDVINRALRLLTVLEAGENAEADDADTALTALNYILHRYPGLAHTDYSVSSTVAFGDKHLGNVSYMLAYEVAGEFGRNIPPIIAKEYPGAQSRFAAEYQYANTDTSLKMSVDGGLLKMPSQYSPGNYRSGI